MRRVRVVSLTALLLSFSLALRAERLPIKTYTTADGLAHDTVTCILRDSRGFLWFCTADGLSRFDGYGFRNFGSEQGLPSAAANNLIETRGGDYWVATDEGLVRFNPKGTPRGRDPMFALIVPDDPDRRARAISVVCEGRDGTIWVGTRKGLYRLEHANGGAALRSVEIGLPNDFPGQREIVDVLEDTHGSLWVATSVRLYRRWRDGTAAEYTTREGVPTRDLSDLFADHEGHVWVASRVGGIVRLKSDGSHDPPLVDRAFGVADGLPALWVTQMFETSDHRFWVGTANGVAEMLATVDDRGRRFRAYTKRDGLTHGFIGSLGEDLGGNLWLGSTNAGAMKLASEGFTTYGKEDGIESVAAVFGDRAGEVCFRGQVTSHALESYYTGAVLATLKADPEALHVRMGCLVEHGFGWFFPAVASNLGWVNQEVTLQARSGDWWIGTGAGLFHFPAADRFADLRTARPLAVYTTHDGLVANQVFRLFEDSRGDIWISTISLENNGLARWDRRTARVRDLADSPGLPSIRQEIPKSFGEDASGAVWIGFNSGLARYRDDGFTFYSARDGLPRGAILNIYLDRSKRLWLASSEGGLVRVDDSAGPRPTFVGYTTANGLTTNNTETIAEDLDGYLYAGGGHGLDRLDPGTGRVKHFSAGDGLVPGLFKTAYRDRSGVLWFGLTNGLARLTPAPDRRSAPPPVLITGLRVTGLPQLVSALGEREMTLADLQARQNQVQIEFVGLGFGSGEVLRYQYRLQGADADWSVPSDQRTVTYASLAPGRYTFVVRAVSSDGIASAQPASIAFRVLPPLWLRWWFLTVAAAAAVFVMRAAYRSRLARVVEMAELRTRIATDLHDDIGANLTRIVLLSEAAQRTPGNARPDTAPPEDGPLASIARIGRESVASMSDIVWAISPARDSLLDLIRRMRRHAEDLFTLRDVELRFNAPDASEHLKLGADVRRDVLLIFKEAVNNAARHSGCSRVDIDLRMEGARLTLTVADNGIGFDPSIESSGQGLVSLSRRALARKGTLDIRTARGTGTTVTLVIPV